MAGEAMNDVKVIVGDCLDKMCDMDDSSIDAIVTDPPYGLSFMGKEWDSFGTDTRQPGDEHYWVPDNAYGRAKVRYGWNQNKSKLRDSMEAFQLAMTPVFEEALRVAKPGAHMLCFGGTRTFHRMASAIEDAGWEIRDCIMWVYGSGFPKSMDVGKAIDKALGADRETIGITRGGDKRGGNYHGASDRGVTIDIPITAPSSEEAKKWDGWGTCLKPAWEPIIVARKPLDGTVANNVLTWGVGALNIDACRVPTDEIVENHSRSADAAISKGKYGNSSAQETHQTSGQQIGRFPANLVHDGSDEVAALFPDTGVSSGGGGVKYVGKNVYGHYRNGKNYDGNVGMGDSGNASRFFNALRDGEASSDRTYADKGATDFAAKPGMRREPASADRFFYCAKASKNDRGEGNDHPTVKPVALMEWLVKLVTPEGGVVLDPFMGSGTTGVACVNLGRGFIGIEKDEHYTSIAESRLSCAQPPLFAL